MNASEESDSPSTSERDKITFKPPLGVKKSMLTHTRQKEDASKTDSEPVSPDSGGETDAPASGAEEESPEVPPAGVPPEMIPAEPMAAQKDSTAAISEKLAKISSIRESSGFRDPVAECKDRSGEASTLPEAMARVNRKYRNEELVKELDRTKSVPRKPKQRTATKEPLNVEDPAPGPFHTLYWFLFRFGRFANGVLLAQSIRHSLFFVLLVALGSVYHSLGLWVPATPGPNSLFHIGFWGRVAGGGLSLGLVCFSGVSFLFHRTVHARYGRVGKGFGVKVVSQAFVPLAAVQITALTAFSFLWGEAFWRGATPPGFDAVHFGLIPLFWVWSGYRLGQAVCGLYAPRFFPRVGIKLSLAAALGALGVLLTYGPSWFRTYSPAAGEWSELKAEVMQTGAALSIDRYDRIEKNLGFRDVSRRRDLYLWRLQAHYIRDERMAARADALRLDRMEPEGSAHRELARGLNYLMQDLPELALARFEQTLETDPSCLPAHQWMALAHAGRDLPVAEAHARRLMRAEPNVFHLQLLVRILFEQEKFEEIWEVMLAVNAPPEAWDPLTLYQGGISARALGKDKRAEVLLELAERKGFDSETE